MVCGWSAVGCLGNINLVGKKAERSLILAFIISDTDCYAMVWLWDRLRRQLTGRLVLGKEDGK